MIFIHYDFHDGSELSYKEGLEKLAKDESFTTYCLDFFSFDTFCNVVVYKKDKTFISKNALLHKENKHTSKQIHKEHNIHKMLKANSFIWIKM